MLFCYIYPNQYSASYQQALTECWRSYHDSSGEGPATFQPRHGVQYPDKTECHHAQKHAPMSPLHPHHSSIMQLFLSEQCL